MRVLIFLVTISAALAACGGNAADTDSALNATANSNVTNAVPAANSNTATAYPRETVDAFLKSCEGAGSDRAFCTCVFERVQAQYSLEEFSAIEEDIGAGEPSDEFIAFSENARAECEKLGSADDSTKD